MANNDLYKTEMFQLDPPSLNEVIEAVTPVLQQNYKTYSVSIAETPDLREPPFHLVAPGLCGSPCIADIGGQPNLFPKPLLDKKYDLLHLGTECMKLGQSGGLVIGAGAGPWYDEDVGKNCELAPNISWSQNAQSKENGTRLALVTNGQAECKRNSSGNCALMMNLYGCEGLQGNVLHVTAKGRTGTMKSFSECLRKGLTDHFGPDRCVSMGGVFAVKKGKTRYHVMPDFIRDQSGQPCDFASPKQLNEWLTYHHWDVDGSNGSEIVCLSTMHSADPGKKMGLRMEHTHCFGVDGSGKGGHYHGDLDDSAAEMEYEGWFNVAEKIYRIDRPVVHLERDLHD